MIESISYLPTSKEASESLAKNFTDLAPALTARLPDATMVDGLFDGLDAQGALLLRLAGGERRVIHAADIFLI